MQATWIDPRHASGLVRQVLEQSAVACAGYGHLAGGGRLGQGEAPGDKWATAPCPPWSRHQPNGARRVGHGNSIHTFAALSQEVELILDLFPRLLYGRLICILNGFSLGFEWSVVGSFQRLTRSRDTCPIPTRITPLIDLAAEHCDLCSDVDHRSPFTAGPLGFDQWRSWLVNRLAASAPRSHACASTLLEPNGFCKWPSM
jgi:hypothetical protein